MLGYIPIHSLHFAGITLTTLLLVYAPDASASLLLSILGSVFKTEKHLLWVLRKLRTLYAAEAPGAGC